MWNRYWLVLVFLLGTGSAALAESERFADVPLDHPAYDAIEELHYEGIMEGDPDGLFHGERPVTRYECALVMARLTWGSHRGGLLDGAKYITPQEREELQRVIKDLEARLTNNSTGLDARLGALEARVAELERQAQSPSAAQPLPRINQVEVMLTGNDASVSEPSAGLPFADVPMSHPAFEPLVDLRAAGLVEGLPDGTFRGDRQMTRAEYAIFIARFYNVILTTPREPGLFDVLRDLRIAMDDAAHDQSDGAIDLEARVSGLATENEGAD